MTQQGDEREIEAEVDFAAIVKEMTEAMPVIQTMNPPPEVAGRRNVAASGLRALLDAGYVPVRRSARVRGVRDDNEGREAVEYVPCPHCGGQGVEMTNEDGGAFRNCGPCKGSGRILARSGVRDDNEGKGRFVCLQHGYEGEPPCPGCDEVLARRRSPQSEDHEAEKDRLHRQIVRDCDAARDRELATRQELVAARRQRDDWKHRAEMLQAEAEAAHAEVKIQNGWAHDNLRRAEAAEALLREIGEMAGAKANGADARAMAKRAREFLVPERTRDGS